MLPAPPGRALKPGPGRGQPTASTRSAQRAAQRRCSATTSASVAIAWKSCRAFQAGRLNGLRSHSVDGPELVHGTSRAVLWSARRLDCAGGVAVVLSGMGFFLHSLLFGRICDAVVSNDSRCKVARIPGVLSLRLRVLVARWSGSAGSFRGDQLGSGNTGSSRGAPEGPEV